MSSDCVSCGDDSPNAVVRLTVDGCRKYGIKGMISLIQQGDRTPDDEMIERRCACRGCEHRERVSVGDVCKLDRLAVHFKTAVASFGCEHWPEHKR